MDYSGIGKGFFIKKDEDIVLETTKKGFPNELELERSEEEFRKKEALLNKGPIAGYIIKDGDNYKLIDFKDKN